MERYEKVRIMCRSDESGLITLPRRKSFIYRNAYVIVEEPFVFVSDGTIGTYFNTTNVERIDVKRISDD